MKNRIDTSRRKTPWDSKEERTILQDFVSKKYKENGSSTKLMGLVSTHIK